MPALPRVEQLVVIATLLKDGFQLHLVAAFLLAQLAVLGRAVLRLHASEQRREFRALGGVVGRRSGHSQLQQLDRALRCGAHRLAFELLGVLDRLAEKRQVALVCLRAHQLCIGGDVRCLCPLCGIDLEQEVGQFGVGPRDELVGGLCGSDGCWHGGEEGNACGGGDGNARPTNGNSDHVYSRKEAAGRLESPRCRDVTRASAPRRRASSARACRRAATARPRRRTASRRGRRRSQGRRGFPQTSR